MTSFGHATPASRLTRSRSRSGSRSRRPSRFTTTTVVVAIVAFLAIGGAVAWVGSRLSTLSDGDVDRPRHDLDADHKRRAEMIISVFQNGAPTPDYGSVELRADGHGLRAGRAGFSSASGDLLHVTERYADDHADSALASYVPILEQLAAEHSADVDQLAGFDQAWAAAADDPAMRELQDAALDELFYRPAMGQASANGLQLPLTLTVLYVSAVDHGTGAGADELGGLIEETNAAAGGNPARGVDETTWLRRFLTISKGQVPAEGDGVSAEARAATSERSDAFLRVLDAGRLNLDAPTELEVSGVGYSFS